MKKKTLLATGYWLLATTIVTNNEFSLPPGNLVSCNTTKSLLRIIFSFCTQTIMKIKNKGKVHPSPSSPSSSSSSSSSSTAIPNSSNGDFLTDVLKLLPAAILALASVLSIEDREVLAYMMTRSMKTTAPSSSITQTTNKKSYKKPVNRNQYSTHKPPLFDCDCFDCYTCYWFRWDSSPNREFIHQAIEAFEDQLSNGEKSNKNSTRNKKKERMGRRAAVKPIHVSPREVLALNTDETCGTISRSHENQMSQSISPEKAADDFELDVEPEADRAKTGEAPLEPVAEEMELAGILQPTAASNNKGFARKVLPDVLGLLNSRLWNLWSPN
ncbi:ATP-dependent tryptophan/phenylalanine/tyrosine adenylase [Quillaja saponaria]|uniref:ATP-dependent tryptophan/phenylalanine/tyrosine adenylase n=1 Tax=Quillaja saponaria TaxID=32244 RepID=A0AAD7LHL8_QUISA|nr:ATP-dependent tryptophan/phenylalanine/tyrosine adenylase [Quillaja saponaria]